MKVFAVRINADPRKGRPYSAYPSQNEYKKIHSKSVGNGFHEAVNFLEEKGMVHGYLPPKPSIELQRSDSFTLVSMSYKGQSSAPDRVFGIQSDCKFVGSTERKNSHGPDLDWHFVCKAENSILFPAGLPNAFASLIGDNPKDWFRGGPTKRIGANRFINFVSAVNDPALEPRRLARFYNFRDRLLSDASMLNEAFEDRVAAAMLENLDNVKGNRNPKRRLVQTVQYDRDPRVVAKTLMRAGGQCEICKVPAPFARRRDGTPYLEVHHKKTLAQGGPDILENTFAVCPNCHRKAHHG